MASGEAPITDGAFDGRFAGRLGATLYAGSGALVLVTMGFDDDIQHGRLGLLAGLAVVVGLLVPSLPWDRHGRLLAALLVGAAQVHLALAEWLVPGSIEHYLSLYILSYLYVGMTQPPGASLLLTPLTVLSVSVIVVNGTVNLINIVVMIPVGILAAEVVSRLLRREAAQLAEVAKVLDATKQLLAATSVDEAALVVGHLIQDLAGSDGVAVFVADDDEPSRFVARMRSANLDQLGQVSVDVDRDLSAMGAAIRGRRTVAVTDVATSDLVVRDLADASRVGSSTLVPLFDGATAVGAITAVWYRAGERLTGSAAQVVELVAAEAGPILNRLRERDRLNWEAETDALTRVANRRTFNRALDRTQPGDALVMVDLDHFKKVNDQRGHAAGDQVLRTMGTCMLEAARDADCVARFGGEEFAIILPGASEAGVRSFLTRLRDLWTATDETTTFSSGYAVRGKSEGPLLTLGRADRALYDAKALGRNTDVEADPVASDQVD